MKTHFLEQIYLSSPVLLQNVIVSIYGAFEHIRRYKGAFKQMSSVLEENEFKSREDLRRIERGLLNKTLKNALETVPYYQHLNIDSPGLEKFPILPRDKVFDNPESFISSKYRNRKLIKLFTGGSSGSPLTVYLSKEIRQKSYAFWNIFYKRMGFLIGEKKASFVGRKIQSPDNNKPPFWRYNLIDRQLIFSSYHLSKENLPIYIKRLNKFKPVIIEGYPQSIIRLAEYILENKVVLSFRPKGISTSSENFTKKQRDIMEEAFHCNVFDQYGSAESVVFAADCEYKNKHVAIEYGLVEILDKNGLLKSEGDGELIVTSFLNDVMPLIRYRIGDYGKISYRDCPCGRKTPILDELYGKVGAVIVSKDKTVPTAAIAIAFEYLKNVKKSQLIQNEPNKVIARLVTTPGFSQLEENFMRWELKKMLGNDMEILVEKVPDIPPGHNGKYQMVVQNYYKH